MGINPDYFMMFYEPRRDLQKQCHACPNKALWMYWNLSPKLWVCTLCLQVAIEKAGAVCEKYGNHWLLEKGIRWCGCHRQALYLTSKFTPACAGCFEQLVIMEALE